MGMITKGMACTGIGMAVAVLAITGGCAAPADDTGEQVSSAPEAYVGFLPIGSRLPCSMSGGPTGRRKAFLVIGEDLRTCYRVPVPGDIPVDESAPHCHEVGYKVGCEVIAD
jgi:hypothetical protein